MGIYILRSKCLWQINFFTYRQERYKNVEFNYKSAIRLPSGEIVFGGLNCYDVFEPKWLEAPLYIKDFVVSGYERISNNQEKHFFPKNTGHLQKVTFNAEDEELIIYLSNKDYANGKLYKFYYQIDDNTWVEMKDARSLRLSSLSVGTHTLRIRMTSPFGMELVMKKMEIRAVVSFYRRPEFIVLILALLLITSLIALYFVRQALKIEMDTKLRISMDLHDEAGTILTRTFLHAQKKAYRIETIQNGLQEALYSIRAFMDSLSRQSFYLNDLQDDIREFFRKSLEVNHLEPHIRMPVNYKQPISAELFRDVKLCVFEMFTNSIKHANAAQIWFGMEIQGKKLVITYEDDGNFDLDKEIDQKGYGLYNLEKRSKRNKGKIVFSKRSPMGLKITMEFLL